MRSRLLETVILLSIGSLLCFFDFSSTNPEHSSTNKNSEVMNSFVSIVEIPATDISRAVEFYQSILEIEIQTIDMQDDEMGIFPNDGQSASVVITKGEGYEPASNGVLVHLNAGDDLNTVLKRIEKNGGKVLLEKTLIDEENGYFALFLDSEGNKMGLHSMN